MNKIEVKLGRWKKIKLNLVSRRMILNHYIIPLVVYYLSCWRPTNAEIKEFVAMCRNFLWVGDPSIKKLVKVKWDHYTIHQQEGGMGIINIQELADRMVAQWIVRGLQNP